MRYCRHRDFSLLTATIFLLAWSHCGEPAGIEKQVCFYDIFFDISSNPGNEVLELFPEMGLPPGHCKIASLEPNLLSGNSSRDHRLPDLHCKNCKSRASPPHFPTWFQTVR